MCGAKCAPIREQRLVYVVVPFPVRLGDDPQFRGSIRIGARIISDRSGSILDRCLDQSWVDAWIDPYKFRPLEWTPCRIDHLGEALPRSPTKIFFEGAPRLSNQFDRVSILGVRISFPPLFSSLLVRQFFY
jgi:hypothetical protein